MWLAQRQQAQPKRISPLIQITNAPQRDIRGKLPRSPLPSPAPVSPQERLGEIVNEIGLRATLDLLAATEKVAA